jgi:hypothetical protein
MEKAGQPEITLDQLMAARGFDTSSDLSLPYISTSQVTEDLAAYQSGQLSLQDLADKGYNPSYLRPQTAAQGGRVDFKRGGIGRQDPMGGRADMTAAEMRSAAPDQFGGGMNISHGGGGGGSNQWIKPVAKRNIDHLAKNWGIRKAGIGKFLHPAFAVKNAIDIWKGISPTHIDDPTEEDTFADIKDQRAKVTRNQYNQLNLLGHVGNKGGNIDEIKGMAPPGTFDSIKPSEWDQIFEGAKFKDIKQVVAEGGRIGFSNGTPGLGLGRQGLMAGIGTEQKESEYLTKKSDTHDVDTMNRIYQEQGYTGVEKYIKRNPHLKDKYVHIYLDPWGEGEIIAVPDKLWNMEKETMGVDGSNIIIKVPENKAQGGRIGYGKGLGPVLDPPEDNLSTLEFMQDQGIPYGEMAGGEYNRVMELMLKIKENIPLTPAEQIELRELMKTLNMSKASRENRVMAQEGGIMDLGGMEKDYRQEGGFVPIGGEEKADDVPARLSKNEFVFTADAVRAAGGGDIDQGAEVMENLMENLEAGGKVSEESQGLEGAREMFANAQELQKRII